jgi:hypothetical protein
LGKALTTLCWDPHSKGEDTKSGERKEVTVLMGLDKSQGQ